VKESLKKVQVEAKAKAGVYRLEARKMSNG